MRGSPRFTAKAWSVMIAAFSIQQPLHATVLSTPLASVEDPGATPGPGDGVYERFQGDLGYRLGAGVEWDMQAGVARPLVSAELLGYQTLGLDLTYRHGLGARDPATNLLSLGLSISPLFLVRWSQARQTGYPHLDMFIDSLTISPGLVLATPRDERFASAAGFEIGLSCGVPLLARAPGPWLRTRFNLMTGREQLGFSNDIGSSVFLYLEWQGFFFAGLLKTENP